MQLQNKLQASTSDRRIIEISRKSKNTPKMAWKNFETFLATKPKAACLRSIVQVFSV